MEIDRRAFIGGMISLAYTANAYGQKSNIAEEFYASTRKGPDGKYSAAIFDPVNGDRAVVVLPGRGHDIAVHPSRNLVVAFARRPDRFAVAFSHNNAIQPTWFQSRKDRHFYGHGTFSRDGKLLYSTENDYENGAGVIGIRDATSKFRQIGEFSSYGIGPHDLAMLSDQRTLVVANGGIETHPDTGREILNRAEMSPNLCYIDSLTGELLEKHDLPQDIKQLSIRHLDVTPDDVVVIGCQYKGAATDLPPLVGFHRRGSDLKLVNAPQDQLLAMKNYVGSVAVDRSGTIAATSSPKGGLTLFWDIRTQRYLGERKIADNCGVARTNHHGAFLITSGQGDVVSVDMKRVVKDYDSKIKYQWDNHVIIV